MQAPDQNPEACPVYLVTVFHIQTFPMCPVVSHEKNLPPKIQPTEEGKPDLTFPGNKNMCSLGN